MNLHILGSRIERLVINNAPTILTAAGVVGTVTTAFLTGQATYRYAQDVRSVDIDLTMREKIEVGWKYFIPPVAVGTFTVASIIGANHISTSRAAGLAAAYTLSEKAYSEYKDKVLEKVGVKPEQAIRDEIAQDNVRRNGPGEMIIATNKVICREAFTGRYFESDMETLKKAQNDLNYTILNQNAASLSDLYDRLGLPHTSYSDDVGWSAMHPVEFKFSTCLTEDQRPCISFEYNVEPVRDSYPSY